MPVTGARRATHRGWCVLLPVFTVKLPNVILPQIGSALVFGPLVSA